MNRFTGRVALVTGGASGIGAAAVTRLRAEGARVAVFDLSVGSADCDLAIAGDVTDSAAVDAAVERTDRELGGLDILICAAGIGAPRPTSELTDDEWNKVFAVNAGGTFFANRAALSRMVPRGYGRIVNIASTAGKEGTASAAYSGSKAAVIGFTRFLGKENAAAGVLVNAIAPGPIATPLFDTLPAEQRAALEKALPIGRLGTAEEVAALIGFLASEEMSFCVGFCFDVSGGRVTY